MTRREHIDQIRAELQQMLDSGEVARLSAGRGRMPLVSDIDVEDVVDYVRWHLHRAAIMEQADTAKRRTRGWQIAALAVAEGLEKVLVWLRAQPSNAEGR